MLSSETKHILNSLAVEPRSSSPSDEVLSLITRLNVLIRHQHDKLGSKRIELARKLRDRLVESYQGDRAELARFSLAFLSAESFLKSF